MALNLGIVGPHYTIGAACAAGNAGIIGALSKVKTFMDTGVFLAVQAAGVAALESWESWVPGNVACFQERRDRVISALHAAGFDVSPPPATMRA